MRVTVEKQPKSSVTLDISAEQDEFSKAMDRAFNRVNQLVNIPGFRPGKAPRRLVEQRVGRDLIVQEAHRDIMDTLYQEALKQEDIVPVSEPEVDIYQDEPVAFKVTIEVYPNVDLGDYSGVSVEPREVNVTDEEIDEVIENVRKQQGVWAEPEKPRSPREGDQVILDFEVYEGQEQFHDPVRGADFVLGEGPLFEQIEEAVKFLQPGAQGEFDITFDEDDEEVPESIRGKTLHYKVTLQEVKERELPEVDDEFAQSIGDYETVDELREAIRKDLLQNKVQQARNEFLNEAFEKLAELAGLEIPEGLINTELDREFEQFSQRLSQQGMSVDEYLRMTSKSVDEVKEEMRPDVANRVRNSLVLEAFGKAESIEITDDEINTEVEKMVGDSEQAEQMRELYQSDYFKNMLSSQLENRKVTERLVEVVSGGQGAITGEGKAFLEELQLEPDVESTEIEGTAEEQEALSEVIESSGDSELQDVSEIEVDVEDDAQPATTAVASDADEQDEDPKKSDA